MWLWLAISLSLSSLTKNLEVRSMAEEVQMVSSIYRASRSIKRKENSLYNALCSIYEDSIFVAEIAQLWPQLPLLPNLRCGLWYSSRFDSTCYFKSTDGHTNNCSFSTSRLNLHVAHLAGKRGGCLIVDSTRKGKRFPDSMSKTIPIWTCVLNRAIKNHLQKNTPRDTLMQQLESNITYESSDAPHASLDWDCSLHLPLWVSESEKAAIGDRLEEWTKQLEASGADIGSLALTLKKPLRPLWISQKSVIWLNEVPDYDSWDFTPIILVSASSSTGRYQTMTTSEFSWNYISGAGDDEESWALGLSPYLFWNHAFDLINSGPELCNRMVADIVKEDRVCHIAKERHSACVMIKPKKLLANDGYISDEEHNTCCPLLEFDVSNTLISLRSIGEEHSLCWLGSTNLAVGTSRHAKNVAVDIDCILNCDSESIPTHFPKDDGYLHLPIVNSKVDRFSLLKSLPSALNFAKLNLNRGKTLLICCGNGEDISICVCLAIISSLFDDGGMFDDGNYFRDACITKWDMRRRLISICQFAINARPSRGNLKQVFCFLNRDKTSSVS